MVEYSPYYSCLYVITNNVAMTTANSDMTTVSMNDMATPGLSITSM